MAPLLQKDFEQFVADLEAENLKADEQKTPLDMNQPDSAGKVLLVEAARALDVRFVDALLQYGASVSVGEPSTGVTALHAAIETDAADVIKMLLAYGAQPDQADLSGVTARQLSRHADLLAQYDEGGPAAFEDAPGVWSRVKSNESDAEFWFNNQTSEARWNTPPSCAWQRLDVEGHPAKYVNRVTGQETRHTPAALAWRFVHVTGLADIWHNWQANTSQFGDPHELPEHLADELKAQKNVRWHNDKTGEATWEDPRYHTAWRELLDEEGRVYYYHVETGLSQYEVPEEVAWRVVEDEEQPGSFFYFNALTGDTSWEAPDHLAWTRHDSDL